MRNFHLKSTAADLRSSPKITPLRTAMHRVRTVSLRGSRLLPTAHQSASMAPPRPHGEFKRRGMQSPNLKLRIPRIHPRPIFDGRRDRISQSIIGVYGRVRMADNVTSTIPSATKYTTVEDQFFSALCRQ